MGPVTAEFEARFAETLGVKYAFAVTNCTAALHLAHMALGAAPGDTIICPSLTFVATANAIRYTGATPVFADITSADDLNISPDDIEAKIDDTTKGICIVHYGGYPCDMDRILDIAKAHQLYVVEDVAHAPGAAYALAERHAKASSGWQSCGGIGDIGCFSFFSNKNLTTGEGGMVTTNADALAEKIRILRSHGMTSLTWDRDRGHTFSYDVVDLGYNYRIDEMRAAIGLVQLNKLENNNQKRRTVKQIYDNLLSDIDEIDVPFSHHQGISSYHIFPIILNSSHHRPRFMEFMKSKGIQTSIHYPLIHHFSDYQQDGHTSHLPISEDIAQRLVTLPLYPTMTREQIVYTVDAIKAWLVEEKTTF
jgi:dTDP-4-amino-4,6-dideoxygalactose transaminase